MGTLDHFAIKDLGLSTKSAFQSISPLLSTVQRNEITYKIGKPIGLRIGSAFWADTLPYEEFKTRISQIINDLALGQVEEIKICMSLLRETKFLVSISCVGNEKRVADSVMHHFYGNGKLYLCCFKSGLLSGLIEQYLKRENIVKEISCGEANKGICQFEILVR